MVDAEDAKQLSKAAIDQAAQTHGEVQQPLHHGQNDQLHLMENGADDEQGQEDSREHSEERREDKVNGIGDFLLQEFFDLASHNTGDEGREDGALIAHHGDKAEEVQRRGRLLTHLIGVGQGGVHQHQADDDANDRISAENAEGGPAHQGGEEGKGRVRQHLGEEDEVGGNAVRRHAEKGEERLLGQKPPQAHEEARGYQNRDNGHKYVAEDPDRPLEAVALLLDRGAGSRPAAGAQDGLHLVVDLVHKAGAEDDLILPGVEEAALYFVQIFHSLHVDLFLVHRDDA